MLQIRYSAMRAILIAAAATATLTATTGGPAAAAEDGHAAAQRQRKMIDVLRSDAPPQNKAITCKHLAIYGDREAVPALAALLSDEKLAAWARIALEVIPGPEADDALRRSLGKLQGRLLVGAINSIGTRRDAEAVDALIAKLEDSDAQVASAAAVALGRIGGPQATETLQRSLAAAPAAVRAAVAEGCILCAERFLDQAKPAEAVRLYDVVRRADVPKLRAIDATRGAILARGDAGLPLLVEQLQSADADRFAIALRTARELAGRGVTDALAAELGRASADRRVLLILALADRGDTGPIAAVLEAAKSGPEEVRTTAIGVLGRLGDASCVPVLLDAALGADEKLAQTALNVLADLPGKQVDDDLAARLPQAKAKARQVLIQLAGRRHLTAAVPALLKAAEDPDATIRSAALTALGHTVGPEDLPVLIARVAQPGESPQETETETAAAALRTACRRMPDREACAERLIAASSRAALPAKCRFLETLSHVGGPKAVGAVAAAAKQADPELQDLGSRLLGEWMSTEAAPALLDLAQTAPQAKYKIRALRGYIRLARQFSMPEQQRAEMCRTALATAGRDEERKLVLEVMERYPSIDMLRAAVAAAKDPALKSHAAAISMVIAQKLGARSADVQKLLARIGHDRVKIEIIKAEYGAGTKLKDVTEALRRHVRDFPLIVLPSSSYNSSFGGDPAPGIVKQLKVRYRINGRPGEASFQENATIVLPIPP